MQDDLNAVPSTTTAQEGLMDKTENDNSKTPNRPKRNQDQEADAKFVRMSFNLGIESANTFKALIERKSLSITEGIRRAIAVWNFFEEETSKGNQIAVIEKDGSIHKAYLL